MAAGDPRLDDRAGEKGGSEVGKSPVDRGRPASKLHLVCDGRGVPLAVLLSAANEHDRQHAIAAVDAIPKLRRGKRDRPNMLLADRGYDAEHIRASLRERGIEPRIPSKRRPGEGRSRDPQARERWRIERTNAWLHNNRRLSTRWERRGELYLAFAQLALSLILCRRLARAY